MILSFTVLACEWRTVFSNTGLVCLILMMILMFEVEATAYAVFLFFSLLTKGSFDHQPVQEQPEYSFKSHVTNQLQDHQRRQRCAKLPRVSLQVGMLPSVPIENSYISLFRESTDDSCLYGNPGCDCMHAQPRCSNRIKTKLVENVCLCTMRTLCMHDHGACHACI